MSEALSTETLVTVTGYVCEIGAINMGLGRGDPKAVGVVLECGERYIEITGLDKEEAKALSPFMRQEVIVRITTVSKP